MANNEDLKKWELEYNLNEERKAFLRRKKEEKIKRNILSAIKFLSLNILLPIVISIGVFFCLHMLIFRIWSGLILKSASILNPQIDDIVLFILAMVISFYFSLALSFLKDFHMQTFLKKFFHFIAYFIFIFSISFIVYYFFSGSGFVNLTQNGAIFDANYYSIIIALSLTSLGLIVYYIILIVKWFNR